jgi:hypothetical protein
MTKPILWHAAIALSINGGLPPTVKKYAGSRPIYHVKNKDSFGGAI